LVVSGEFRFLGNPCPGAGQRLDGLRAHFRRSCALLRINPPTGLDAKNTSIKPIGYLSLIKK
ncbi:hypothetical protein ACVGWG_00225, partial [Enterobacter asburiae]